MSGTLEIEVASLAAWRENGEPHQLLDVREIDEHDAASISGDVHIPMGEVPHRLAEIAKDRPVVVMCHHGGRSMRVTQWLRQQGYDNAVNLAGGIDAWSCYIDPSVPRY